MANFSIPYTTSANYTYDSDKIEIDSGLAKLKKLTSDDETFYASYNTDINGSRGDGVLTGTPIGGASVSGGKLDLAHNDLRYVKYQGDNNISDNVGTIRFKYTPNYNQYPSGNKFLVDMNTVNNNNEIMIAHFSSSAFYIRIKSESGYIINTNLGSWKPTQGQEYEIELNWDIISGATRLFIDGVQFGNTRIETGTKNVPTNIFIGTDVNASALSNFLIDDFQVFSSVQHTANYTPESTSETKYADDSPTIYKTLGDEVANIEEWISFTETLGLGNQGDVRYQLSYDGINWMFWNRSFWDVAPTVESDIDLENIVKASVVENTITKTGINLHWDAGANSSKSFSANGGVSFVATQTNVLFMCGLTSNITGIGYGNISYAIYINNGYINIFEDGISKGGFGTFLSGDIFIIERNNGIISYKKNDTVFYTSSILSSDDLFFDCSLYTPASILSDVKFVNIEKYNTALECEAHMLDFTASYDKIYVRAFLISNGSQKVELDLNEVGYVVNTAPVVYAGTNKTAIYNVTVTPFSDGLFSDAEGNIIKAEWKEAGGSYAEISKGSYATLLEAVQAFEYTAVYSGTKDLYLKITDSYNAYSEDYLTISVNRVNVDITIKDSKDNHLPGVLFNPGDGTTASIQNSPFSFIYYLGTFIATLTKNYFNSVSESVNLSILSNNIDFVMSREPTMDELIINVNAPVKFTFGDSFTLNCVINTDLTDYKIRCSINDKDNHEIKLATSNSGGSNSEIEVINASAGEFIISCAKDLTDDFNNNANIEIEIENSVGQVRTMYQQKIIFEDENLTWTSSNE